MASVVVGVTLHQPEQILEAAVRFAAAFDAELVCAHVDVARYPTGENPDGSVDSLPFDPDLSDLGAPIFDPTLARQIEAVLGSGTVRWSLRALAGDPALALSRLADSLGAVAIVVGTRRRRAGIQEFFAGSIAMHLAHRQHRPVIVVPLSPVDRDADLPWEG